MLKLVTGSPGDGKTSNELWMFLKDPVYDGRPKYCTPITGFDAQANGVTEIEHLSCWQDLPDGSVLFCDEVQIYCGNNIPDKNRPEWIEKFAVHRHRGFDFILTTQSPMFLNSFARKLVKPHVHYFRPWNMKGARYTWDNVQNDPSSKASKALGQRSLVTPNPEVFKLYTSTVLDTHKPKPPYKLIATAILSLAALFGFGGYAFYKITNIAPSAIELNKVANPTQVAPLPERLPERKPDAPITLSESAKPVWTQESTTPRVAGLAYTAPIYDALTEPTDFPRVAACMSSESRGTCKCYTQQGTPLDVPASACFVYIKVGSFDPWLTGRRHQQEPSRQEQPKAAEVASSRAPIDAGRDPVAPKIRGAQYTVVEDTSRGGRNVLK